ncbi:MarR family winged helix-turn-helix transcriptional regulator [Halalkalibacter akibai]|nr:hypothetical protein [Halalkalibacter akibai]
MRSAESKFNNSYLLYTLIRGINFEIEQDIRNTLKKSNFSFPSFRILWILYFQNETTMTNLAHIAQTNISNIFRQLIILRDDGFVLIENAADARMKKVNLTARGKEMVSDFIRENQRQSELKIVETIDKISEEELKVVFKVASLLSSELVGDKFTSFVMKSHKDL